MRADAELTQRCESLMAIEVQDHDTGNRAGHDAPRRRIFGPPLTEVLAGRYGTAHRLKFTGIVNKEREFSLADLCGMRAIEVAAGHECSGNSARFIMGEILHRQGAPTWRSERKIALGSGSVALAGPDV
jgi:hypothetical protein